MLENCSNAELLEAWRQGEQEAARILFDRYVIRLCALARSRLSRQLNARFDPEDVVYSAYRSFFVGVRDGKLHVPERDQLWSLLVTITLRKLHKQVRRNRAGGRDYRRELSTVIDPNMLARAPTAEDAAIVSDEVQVAMRKLDPLSRRVLTLQLLGKDTVSIALELNCSERTVRRSSQRVLHRLREGGMQSQTSPSLSNVTASSGNFVMSQEPEATYRYDQLLLRQLIGKGGFAKVYAANDRIRNELVAVKFLHKTLWQNDRSRRGVLQEFEILTQIRHPHIIRCYGWGKVPAGGMFLVTERIAGSRLDDWWRIQGARFNRLRSVLVQMAEGLEAAHAKGVIHADLNPSNVMVNETGEVKILDFGLSRWRDVSNFDSAPVGTLGFMAPEQLSSCFGQTGKTTDVYGFGATLYALMTGHAPVQGERQAEIIVEVLSERSPALPFVSGWPMPRWLTELVSICVAKQPKRRFQDFSEVLAVLRNQGDTEMD